MFLVMILLTLRLAVSLVRIESAFSRYAVNPKVYNMLGDYAYLVCFFLFREVAFVRTAFFLLE